MKVKIGKSLLKKRAKADLGYDVTTTTSFGHCQPIMCKEMVPNTEYKVEVDSLVRLSPLVKPTFGRMKYKIWHSFVPIADLYRPFENMLSQTPFTNVSGTEYIPTSVPDIKLSTLAKAVYGLDFYATVYNATTKDVANLTPTALNRLYVDGTQFVAGSTAQAAVFKHVGSTFEKTHSPSVPYYCKEWLASSSRPWYTQINDFGILPDDSFVGDNYAFLYKDKFSDITITPDAADMVWIAWDPNVSYWDDGVAATNKNIMSVVCQKLTERQRNLRKILLGLGYQLDTSNDTYVSVLPLIAFYKAWFTTLYPERNKTWSQTNAYKLMEALADYGNHDVAALGDHAALFRAFLNDLSFTYYYDDADYYTAHIDNTAEFVGNGTTEAKYIAADGRTRGISTYNDFDGELQQPQITQDIIVDDEDNPVGVSALSDVQLRLLRILTKFVNKNTSIGGKVAEYLRAHYGADVVNNLLENYFIGGDSTDVQISDVMSNASTETAELADYAGKGIGYKDGKTFTYKTDTFGYWIAFTALVPKSRWYQGVDPNLFHKGRFEFFTPEFDALGFQLSQRAIMNTSTGVDAKGIVSSNGSASSASFGFIPRYSEYKVPIKNILNGDITLPSTRNDNFPYTIDKSFTPVTWVYSETQDGNLSSFKAYAFPQRNIVADPILRRIGADESYGNYDRIFYSNESVESQFPNYYNNIYADVYMHLNFPDDNFLVHHVVNIDAKLPMIPMSESFDTGGDEDDAMRVDKV